MPYTLRIDRREINERPTRESCVLELEVQTAARLAEVAGQLADLLAERMTPEEAARELGVKILRVAAKGLR